MVSSCIRNVDLVTSIEVPRYWTHSLWEFVSLRCISLGYTVLPDVPSVSALLTCPLIPSCYAFRALWLSVFTSAE